MSSKKILVPLFAAGIIGFGLLSWAQVAQAQTGTGTKDTIIDRLVKKFNLKKEDVTAVFDEASQARQKEMQSSRNNKLDEAVKAGVITKDQKQKILDKQADLQNKHQQELKDLDQWYKDNGINRSKLMPYTGHYGRFHGRRGHGHVRH